MICTKLTTSIVIGLLLSISAAAQKTTGGITEKMLRDIESKQTPADRALSNAIASNNIDNLAKNRRQAPMSTYFSIETPKQSITDQKQSGRCWMFSGFNVLRSDYARTCKNDSLRKDYAGIELSQDFLFFYDQLEKSNLFLQGVIDTSDKPMENERVRFFFQSPIGDGGTFCGVADLAEKYGLVPAEVCTETYSAENTSKMRALLKSKLRQMGLQLRNAGSKAKAEKLKPSMLAEVYHMLVMTLGEPIKTFSYTFRNKDGKALNTKQFTPKTFYDEVVGRPLNGSFIMVMNDPRRPYHKTYEVEYDRHTYDGHNWKYLNLPMEDIEQLAIAQLRDGRKLYSSYDVGKQFDRKRGYLALDNYDYTSLFGDFTMNKAERIATFDSGSTHAMTLTAVDLDADGKPLQWKVENSWGSDHGQKGCLIMTAEWFREYMFRLVVDKQYVPENILREAEQKPIMVMPEDPLFMEDE
ncbi:MAG: C1 family peptidase [Prevotella sp.]|nr:C1 family peptidase [Prevotella sp.]